MKRHLIMTFMMLVWASGLLACDACGCSIIGQPIGMLTAYQRNYISLGWGRSGFTSTPGNTIELRDGFQVMDLSVQYYLTRRLKAGVYLPFRMNQRISGENRDRISGLSDVRLSMQYILFPPNGPSDRTRVHLEVGLGVGVPTGQYDPDIHDRNLPENFNPGNGSWSLSINQALVLQRPANGLILRNNLAYNFSTAQGYRFGHQWMIQGLAYHQFLLDSALTLMPMAGLGFEQIGKDHYATGATVHGTGGHGTLLQAGVQFRLLQWLFTFQWATPLVSQYSDKEVKASNRLNLQMTHTF